MKVDFWKKTLHRCPHCSAVGIVVGSEDRPGEWNILWAFPGTRDVIGGPSEVAIDIGASDADLDAGDFGCGYCGADVVDAVLAERVRGTAERRPLRLVKVERVSRAVFTPPDDAFDE